MARYIDCDKCYHGKVCAERHFYKNSIVACKQHMPTADVVEVKHGRWKIKTDEYDCEYMMCSVCKEEFYPVDADTVDTTPNYCPNCGAKMDLEEGAQE